MGCRTNSCPCRSRKTCKTQWRPTVVCRPPSKRAYTGCTCPARRVRVCENLKLLKGAYLSYGHPQLVWCSLRSLEVITDPALFCTMQKCEAGGATFNWCNAPHRYALPWGRFDCESGAEMRCDF